VHLQPHIHGLPAIKAATAQPYHPQPPAAAAGWLPARDPACLLQGQPLPCQFLFTLTHTVTGCLRVELRQPTVCWLLLAGCLPAWLPACQYSELLYTLRLVLVHLKPHIDRLPASGAVAPLGLEIICTGLAQVEVLAGQRHCVNLRHTAHTNTQKQGQ
jgi:hypothetical protein